MASDPMHDFFVIFLLIVIGIGSIIFFFLALYQMHIKKEESILTSKLAIILFPTITAICIIKLFFNLSISELIYKALSFIISIWKLIIILITLMALAKIINAIRNKINKRNEKFLDELNKIKRNNENSIEEAKNKLNLINELAKEKPRLAKKYKEETKEAIKEIKNRINVIKDREREEELEEKKRQEEEEEKWEETRKLVKYFQKVSSSKAMPKWAKYFNPESIKEAKEEYKEIVKEKEKKDAIWKEAKEFVLENKAYPTDYPKMDEEEQRIYDKAVRLLEKGELKPEQEEVKQETETNEHKKLLDDPVHHVDLLRDEEKEILLKHGYRIKPFITIYGEVGNNLLIKHDNKNETDYHFCMKYEYRQLDYPNAHVEYGKGELRADIAFVYPEGKISLEIETGTNKKEQIIKKVGWLNEHFDYWIFICSRKNLKLYKKYVDKKKSFCLTLKEATEKADDLIDELTGAEQL